MTRYQWRTRTEKPLTSGQISSHSQLTPKAGSSYFGVIRLTGLLPHALVGTASVKTFEKASSTLVAFQLYWQPRKHPLPHHTNVAVLYASHACLRSSRNSGSFRSGIFNMDLRVGCRYGTPISYVPHWSPLPIPPHQHYWYERLGRK